MSVNINVNAMELIMLNKMQSAKINKGNIMISIQSPNLYPKNQSVKENPKMYREIQKAYDQLLWAIELHNPKPTN